MSLYAVGSYSSARVPRLMSRDALERLIGSPAESDARLVLHDTFIAPHLGADTPIPIATRHALAEVKNDIMRMAQNTTSSCDIIWLKYDFYNIRTMIKGVLRGTPEAELLSESYRIGTITPAKLLSAISSRTLSRLNPKWKMLNDLLDANMSPQDIDAVVETQYFEMMRAYMEMSNDPFLKRYIRLRIDAFNIKTVLRRIALPESVSGKYTFIHGGDCSKQTCTQATIEELVLVLARFGGAEFWRPAIDALSVEKSFLAFDRTLEEYVVRFLRNESRIPFSSASLFLYFYSAKHAIQTIRSIRAAHSVGLSEGEIRTMIRNTLTT